MTDPRRKRADGVRTIRDIKARCRIDDITGCWHWSMAMTHAGKRSSRTPTVNVPAGLLGNSTRKTLAVARLSWLLSGKPLPAGHVVWRCCVNDECCAPHHLRAGTKADEGAWMAASGHRRGNPARAAVNVSNVEKTQALPTATVRNVEQALTAGQLQTEISAKFGVSLSTISRIANGKHLHQRHGVANASVFVVGAGVLASMAWQQQAAA